MHCTSARPTSSSWMNCIGSSGANTGPGRAAAGAGRTAAAQRRERAGQDVLAADGVRAEDDRRPQQEERQLGVPAGLVREQLLELGLLLGVEELRGRPRRPVLVDRAGLSAWKPYAATDEA